LFLIFLLYFYFGLGFECFVPHSPDHCQTKKNSKSQSFDIYYSFFCIFLHFSSDSDRFLSSSPLKCPSEMDPDFKGNISAPTVGESKIYRFIFELKGHRTISISAFYFFVRLELTRRRSFQRLTLLFMGKLILLNLLFFFFLATIRKKRG
jgi:hypothetical protein